MFFTVCCIFSGCAAANVKLICLKVMNVVAGIQCCKWSSDVTFWIGLLQIITNYFCFKHNVSINYAEIYNESIILFHSNRNQCVCVLPLMHSKLKGFQHCTSLWLYTRKCSLIRKLTPSRNTTHLISANSILLSWWFQYRLKYCFRSRPICAHSIWLLKQKDFSHFILTQTLKVLHYDQV